MARIKVLDQTVAELIAAGEVVERPASIIKELIENSIDAGSSKITVEIKGGGIGYIRVSDNGSGIHEDDIPSAFLRHATSKVATADDLVAINTLGFRGEALSSIAAVSRLEITTKTPESEYAWFYEIHGGAALEIPRPVGAPNGTTFIIRDVFYNTPARMKFLRSDIAEGNAVAQVVDKAALANPEVSFTFIRDTKTRLQTSGNGDLLAVISTIYGREFAEGMLPVDYVYENRIKVHGYAGKPSNSKANRGYQTFYINNRYVRTNTGGVALNEAYKGKMMIGRFPVGVLFVDIDSSQVDANVHPAKIEVRFTRERDIYSAVYFGVKSALAKMEAPIIKRAEIASVEYAEPVNTQKAINLDYSPIKKDTPYLPENHTGDTQEDNFNKTLSFNSPTKDTQVKAQPAFKSPSEEAAKIREQLKLELVELPSEKLGANEQKPSAIIKQPLKFIGELFKTYIILEKSEEEILLVDKHAAHEQVNYRKVKKNTTEGVRQTLLSPIPVTLHRDEYTVLLENLDVLEKLGFLVEDFGTGTLIVRETAVLLAGEDVEFLLSEIAQKLLENRKDITPNSLDRLYFSIACRSSVMAGDHSSKEELMEIIKMLQENPDITHCPHGRPIIVAVSRKEIEKIFGRLG